MVGNLVKLFIGKKRKKIRKRIAKRDKEHELNVFYDTSRFNNNVNVMQKKLQTVIVIGQTGITSLNVIAQLNNLKELWFVECSLKDIAPLKNNLHLEKLYLYSNEIREIPDFSNLKGLRILSLARNKISHLEGLRKSFALRDLNMADNEIQKIDNIFSSNFLLSHINFSANKFKDLEDIENLWLLKNLKSIEFDDPLYGKCPLIESLFNYRQYFIRHLPSLCEIDFYSISREERNDSHKNEILLNEKMLQKYLTNGSTNFKLVMKILRSSEFLHIKHLKMSGCSIVKTHLQDIFLPQLESLDISKNKIQSLDGLRSMINLHSLCVSYNELGVIRENIEEVFPLEIAEFPNLKIFYADNNEIQSIRDANFPKMPSLRCIFLQHNKINDIDGIQDFPCLNTLVLDDNKIDSVVEDTFFNNSEIKSLFLENNKLTCLRFVKKLENIEKLFIANNRLKDKFQLENLKSLAYLREMTILGNPFCKKCNYYLKIHEFFETIKMIDGHSIHDDVIR